MLSGLFNLTPRLLAMLPPEEAHEATLKSLELGLFPRAQIPDHPGLSLRFADLTLPNPVGIAAGFDKDARVPDALLAFGCGFTEVGTVTPRAQAGNPRPRIFRLPRDRAVINRLGFNNAGHHAAFERLRWRFETKGVIGVNVGANKDAEDRIADYVAGLEAFVDVASYLTVNISSPNTPGLRDLQAPAALDQLLSRLMEARANLAAKGKRVPPIVIKLSPDVAEDDLGAIVERLVAHKVDGIAVSNTTLSRFGLTDAAAREAGGLSGRPLFHRSTVSLARVYLATEGKVPLIGIGGIDSGQTALAKIAAGATLIQLYTGLIYEGPGLIARIKSHLAKAVRAANVAALTDLVGSEAKAWAAKPLDA
ncbi:MAG TPA: quinone-dependent dihydroorotate dehydrogenase [Hyphomicrobium sp.]